ncbi:hypothetical protein ACFU6M_27025, partial [Streptomyces bottropensis]
MEHGHGHGHGRHHPDQEHGRGVGRPSSPPVRGAGPRVGMSLAVPSDPLLSTVQERLAAREKR